MKLLYTPKINYHGPDSFVYKANDKKDDSGTANITITITSVNDAPSLVTRETISTDEDVPITVSLEAEDPEKPETIVFIGARINDESMASVSVTGSGINGSLTITPKSNMNGTANIEIDLSDGILSNRNIKSRSCFVSDAPTDILLGNESVETFNTNETNSIGSFITNISADDVDNPYGDIHQFELINHVDEYVLIDNGDLLVNKALDHESLNEFPITIKATDKDSHIFTKTL